MSISTKFHSIWHEDHAEKTKLMTNNTSGISTEIKVNIQKFETVTSFKCPGSVINDEGPSLRYSPGQHGRRQTMTRLKPVWNDRSVSKIPTDVLPYHIHLPVCL